MTHLDDLPDLLTVAEFAEFARVDRNTAYAAVKAGTVPSIRLSARVIRVPKHALASMLAGPAPPENENGPGVPPGPKALDDRGADEGLLHG